MAMTSFLLVLTLVRTTTGQELLTVTTGSDFCSIDSAGCVTDGAGSYGDNEACTITANQAITVSSTYFSTEETYDYITVGGTQYSGTIGPSNVAMPAGSTMTWYSDGSNGGDGFTICPTACDSPAPSKAPLPDGCYEDPTSSSGGVTINSAYSKISGSGTRFASFLSFHIGGSSNICTCATIYDISYPSTGGFGLTSVSDTLVAAPPGNPDGCTCALSPFSGLSWTPGSNGAIIMNVGCNHITMPVAPEYHCPMAGDSPSPSPSMAPLPDGCYRDEWDVALSSGGLVVNSAYSKISGSGTRLASFLSFHIGGSSNICTCATIVDISYPSTGSFDRTFVSNTLVAAPPGNPDGCTCPVGADVSGLSWTPGSNGAIRLKEGSSHVTMSVAPEYHCMASSCKGQSFLSSPGGVVVIVGVVLVILGLVYAVIVWQKRKMKKTAAPTLNTIAAPGRVEPPSTDVGGAV